VWSARSGRRALKRGANPGKDRRRRRRRATRPSPTLHASR
jgi:hypothetical protein